MPVNLLEHLLSLVAAPGLPGHEGLARDVVRAAWAPLVDTLAVDPLGSLAATRLGRGPASKTAPRRRALVSAHLDTIGLMVSQVDGDWLRLSALGGVDARVLPGQPVTVHATRGARQELPGLVAAPPAAGLPKALREKAPPVTELLVDTGLPGAELTRRVQVGDLVSFARRPVELPGGRLAAPGLDNRASLAALTLCLEALHERPSAWDVVMLANVQEEVNVRGAGPAAFALQPDLAIVVDTTFGADGTTGEFGYRALPPGGGPALGLGPNIHPGLHADFRAAAERAEIPYSVEPLAGGNSGTDAFAIQVARAGLPTMVVSVPLRNMHTPVEIVMLKDITRTARLLAEFLAGLAPDYQPRLDDA
jgi:endoglucanase